jgi:hypothetical protein
MLKQGSGADDDGLAPVAERRDGARVDRWPPRFAER